MRENAIEVRDLKLSYVSRQSYSIKQTLFQFKKSERNVVEALKGVSFDAVRGEVLGVVGRNGSGKSTLLRTLAGVFSPDSGTIDLKSGSTVTSNGLFELYSSSGSITIGGKVTSTDTLYVQGASVIAETGSVISSGYCSFSGQTQNYGKISHTGRNLNFNGRLENYGTIKITRSDGSSSYASASNTGYTIVNAESGTIELGEGCTLSVNGTVLQNQGTIPGAGTLYIGNTESDSEYQNGIGRIEQDTSRNYGPDNYGRGAFTAEPAATMKVVTFFGKFVNEGSYTITVVDSNN